MILCSRTPNVLIYKDSKEIKPVQSKGNQPWIFIGRTDAETEAPILWPPGVKRKRFWCWERLRARGEGATRGWGGWMTSRTQWTCVWVNSGSCDGPGGLACCNPWDGRVTHDWGTGLNWSKEDSRLYLCSTVRKSDSLSYLKGFSFFFSFLQF